MSANTLNTLPVQDLAGRVAVITGASSGIGRASALLLSARGAKVALLARRKAQLDELAAEIRLLGGMAIAIITDVTDPASVEAAAATVKREYGDADLVFNNAGLMLPGAIGQQPRSEWETQIDLNVTGAMHVIQAFIPQLEAAAAQGKVVDLINTSSIAGQYVFGYFAVYSATKAFVSHLTRHLRVELGPKNIRVSVIEPGITDTELQGHFTFQSAIDWLKNAAQSIDFLKPEDVAATVGFIVSQPRHVNLQQVVIMPTKEGI
jgi:NADP-dependent 3-hydroxy acid dehydrogenase YdfG